MGNMTLQHRVVFAPCIRFRAREDRVPYAMASEYYAQRATKGGLFRLYPSHQVSGRKSRLTDGSLYRSCP
ncbi:hypothetical protein BC936DRAFT_136895 [Jimgerdemannia flammicorona]|uniref:Uncharacterized protein n=2 Tax=Jimgerdemannia flammicorona TaxID=994334 RepID=A0A433CYK6_9FUNG|nr:hypothetical protein BC936DRAFT_136895 [Jimgerdemannia flammicorona]RUS32406.1 hypothetical protein BC938DRAFT_475473 [Jimgerdemannia flammicorona]